MTNDEALVLTLSRALHERTLTPAMRWQHGTVDAAVVRLTAAARTPEQIDGYPTVAAAFAAWHAGRAAVHPGRPGTNLGRAMRQLGRPGAYGPRDHAAVRCLDRLLLAQTPEQLHRAVVQVARALAAVAHPPHWVTLADDLTRWHTSPTQRDQVRHAWARAFHTHIPTEETR